MDHLSTACLGNLYTERRLDRESVAVHILKLSVMDEGGRASFSTVRVTIRDRNDNPPIFTLPEYQANININVASGTTILKVKITSTILLHLTTSF